MLTKFVAPRTKAELIRALQSAAFSHVDVFEGERLARFPSVAVLKGKQTSVIVLS